ncbi:MAG: type II toxin-antitoxin system HicA family toxin [Nitrospirota bacterium]
MKTREIIKLLENDGWYQVDSKGGHRQFKHPTKSGRVTVPFHGGNEYLPAYLVANILRQAKISK